MSGYAARENKGLIRDYVYETLKKEIMELRLEPGRSLSEKEAIEMLQVSRSPIREAFVRLAQEDLIETIPQKGSFVSLIDLERVEESRFARVTLEAAIIRQACAGLNAEHILHLQNNLSMQALCMKEKNNERIFHLDEAFHRSILEGCGKGRTWVLLQQMNVHYNRVRFLRLADNADWNTILSQHKEMVDAIDERDPDRAERVLRRHLNQVVIEKEDLKQRYPTYFK